MSEQTQLVTRHSFNERFNHWVVAIVFIMLALSGLALFHPVFFFLTSLFGGGTWARILHPFLGLVMFVSFVALGAKVWKDNRINNADREWRKHLKAILANRPANLPEIGKYNIAQKYIFWTLAVAVPALLVSGFIMWQPYFAPAFPIALARLAVVVHAFAAFIAVVTIIAHVYAGIWTRGSIRSMTRGTVTAAWARQHHPGWYKEVSKGMKQ